jgi:hypothetical protein
MEKLKKMSTTNKQRRQKMSKIGSRGQIKYVDPKKMKKDGVTTQFCIDGYTVDEVLSDLPSNVSIIGAQVGVGQSFNKRKMIVPTKLKKLGVASMRATLPTEEASLVFDEVDPKTIRKSIEGVCDIMGVEKNKSWFKYITLATADGSAFGKFERTTKEIRPDETDLRKKLTVLGLTEGRGKMSNLIRAISANKYECKMQEVSVRTVMCNKLS